MLAIDRNSRVVRRCAATVGGCLLVLLLLGGGPALGQTLGPNEGGIKVNRAHVLFGQPRNAAKPAEVDIQQAVEATVEWRQIQSENVDKGSAKYQILMSKALARVRKAVAGIAVAEGRDCVVKQGAILENPDNLQVVDLTDAVVAALSKDDGDETS